MEFDMSDIKPTVLSAVTILLIVAVMVPLSKFLLNRWPIPGLTDLVNAI
jgi:hypothetical protein